MSYFNSDFSNKNKVSVKTVFNQIYYRDIFIFIDRFIDLVTIKEKDLIQANIYILFRDIVLVWYIFELIEFEQQLLYYISIKNSWLQILY